ncbi:MAG: hypothetical protein P8Y72_03570 [Anaerolineales bacterium]
MADISFTSKPENKDEFTVGDFVEVNCDHENDSGERVRGWLTGIVVQVDPKIVAVQFEQNVYLTDGWMVPDHVLWFPHNSSNIRFARKKKRRQRSS